MHDWSDLVYRMFERLEAVDLVMGCFMLCAALFMFVATVLMIVSSFAG